MSLRNQPESGLLHQRLRVILCEKIWLGEYPDGARLPTERALAQRYGMSRVTVRSTLAAMEREGLISRRQGHGTHVTLRTGGHRGTADIIAIIAPAQNPFFSSFLQGFEAAAETHDALVVFKQTSARGVIDILFRFYQRGIRNVVVWPYDEEIESERLVRIRGLGMNLVFFDRVLNSPAVDSVSVDNGHAVRTLHAHLVQSGCMRIAYIGWKNQVLTSNREREAAFTAVAGRSRVYRLKWTKETGVDTQMDRLLDGIKEVDGLLCGNGVIGIEAKRYCVEHGLDIHVACVDDLPGAAKLNLTTYSQPMNALAGMAYKRLIDQNWKADTWKPRVYRLKGRLHIRG